MSALGELERVRPAEVRAGSSDAVFVEAWAYDKRHVVERAELRIADQTVPAVALGLERRVVFEEHRATPQRSINALTSGMIFAGVVGPLAVGRHRLEVIVQPAGAAAETVIRDEVAVVGPPATALDMPVGDVEVVVVLATYNPPADLVAAQIESIRRQQGVRWRCIVCDDASAPDCLAGLRAAIGDDDRFVLVENRRRVGFYLNFERALAAVPLGARFVALCDQDDVWHPDKLRRQVAALGADQDLQLVASDVRITDTRGDELAPTFYDHRAPSHDDPYSLFAVNSLIGASMVFRRGVLDVALPFPRAFEDRFHDHWLARVAAATGRVGFLPDALHDYVQHGENAWGSRTAQRWPLRPFLRSVAKRCFGGSIPAEWEQSYVDFVLESAVAARLIIARCPRAASLPWLARFLQLEQGQARELTRVVLDHVRESRSERPRRENVELSQFMGRMWGMTHPAEMVP